MLRSSLALLPLVLSVLASCGCAAAPRHAAGPPGIRLVLAAPEARSVAVAGTFNRWDTASHPLVRTAPDGTWTIVLPLPPGRYEYLFVVDGSSWMPDPAAAASDDGLGGKNSVLTVPDGEAP